MLRVWFCMPLQKGSQELQLLQSLLDNRGNSIPRFRQAKQNLNPHSGQTVDYALAFSLFQSEMLHALAGLGGLPMSARHHSFRSPQDSPHS